MDEAIVVSRKHFYAHLKAQGSAPLPHLIFRRLLHIAVLEPSSHNALESSSHPPPIFSASLLLRQPVTLREPTAPWVPHLYISYFPPQGFTDASAVRTTCRNPLSHSHT